MEKLRQTCSKTVEYSGQSSIRTKCQFCFAFYNDPVKTAEHIRMCSFRFAEQFIAFDENIKFACSVCRDVFNARSELTEHEQQHMLPGGFVCPVCKEIFQTDSDWMQHAQSAHNMLKCQHCARKDAFVGEENVLIVHCKKVHNIDAGRFAICFDCGANFEQKTYLRLHTETKCGQFQSWHCNKCTSISDDPKVHASVEDRAKPIHKSDIVAHDMALNGYGESLEETCSVFIEDPILMAMKREDDLNWEQCEEGDENDQIIIDEFKREDLIDEFGDEVYGSESEIKMEIEPTLHDIAESTHEEEDDDCIDPDDNDKSTQKPFKCKICGAGFGYETIFKNHVDLHGPDGNRVHKCTCCRLLFASTSEMKEHRNHKHLNEIKCFLCNKVYTTRAEKTKHLQRVHKQKIRQKQYECAKCDFKILRKDLLDLHIANNCERVLLFKCKLCSIAFGSQQEWKAHRDTHDERACEICHKVYPTLIQLISHKKMHEEKLFKCEYCDKSFLLHVTYLKHVSAHTGIKPFKCSSCNKRFMRSAERDTHERCDCKRDAAIGSKIDDGGGGEIDVDVPDPEKIRWILQRGQTMFEANFQCHICNMKFVRQGTMSKHILKHGPNADLIHRCVSCYKYFGSKEELKSHKHEVHGQNLTCHFCRKVFKTSGARVSHIRTHHSDGSALCICSKCGAAFKSRASLEDHEKSDCGQKPAYSCEICEKRFIDRKAFGRHLKKHEGTVDETFSCETCGKTLRSKYNLICHMRIHTGEMPFKCAYCGKAFRHQTDHKLHEISHSGVKLYECAGCGAGFSCNSNLRKHRQVRKDTCGLAPLYSLKQLNRTMKTQKNKV